MDNQQELPAWPWPKSPPKELGPCHKDWYDAVTDACVINCIGWKEADAEASLANLIEYEILMALDPAINDVKLTQAQLIAVHQSIQAAHDAAQKDERPFPFVATELFVQTVLRTYLQNRVEAIQQQLQKTL